MGLTGCSDSNWCTGKSITGYLLILGNAAVAWSSKKQPSTAISSSEAETFAAAAATAETLWARGLLGELGWPQLQATTLWMDNAGAVRMAQNAESVGRSRHIARRASFLQEASAHGHMRMQWLSTDHLAADLLTKPLDRRRFVKLRAWMMGESAAVQQQRSTLAEGSVGERADMGQSEFVQQPSPSGGARSVPALGRSNMAMGDSGPQASGFARA